MYEHADARTCVHGRVDACCAALYARACHSNRTLRAHAHARAGAWDAVTAEGWGHRVGGSAGTQHGFCTHVYMHVYAYVHPQAHRAGPPKLGAVSSQSVNGPASPWAVSEMRPRPNNTPARAEGEGQVLSHVMYL